MFGSMLQFSFALGGAVAIFLFGKLLVAAGHRACEPLLAWTRPKLGQLDQGLAGPIAQWLGLDESKVWRRWGRLLGMLFAFGAVGAFAPWPAGVAALVLGLVAVLAVFRRWAWDEEDRALGLGAEDRRFPSLDDYGNEALAALAAVFMLSSLLVWRLTGAHAFEGPGADGEASYLVHILSEFFVSLPIIGNVEVLGYQDPSGVQPVLPNGGAIAFVLRMALDLLVIGGLLKAVEIARRIGRGQDLRREEEALASRELARVLPSIKRLRRLALGGDLNAVKMLFASVAGNAGQAPRARLCAIHALREIAAQRPEWAAAILLDCGLACSSVLNDQATVEAGLMGAAHVERAELAAAQSRFSKGEEVLLRLVDAISHTGQAVLSPGLTPLPDAFLLDNPEPTSVPARSVLVLRIAKLKVTLAELSHAENVFDLLTEALSHLQAVFKNLSGAEPARFLFDAHQTCAEVLCRLGQLHEGDQGNGMLASALDAYVSAEAQLGEDEPFQRVRLWMGRGVVHEVLGHRMKDAQALNHFAEAARWFESAAKLAADDQLDRGETARCYLNFGNACRSAADVAGDDTQARNWLDRALQADDAALQMVGQGHWPAQLNGAFQGLAIAYERRFLIDGNVDDLIHAVASRYSIIQNMDQEQDPVGWALEAIETSRVEYLQLRFAESASVGERALDRLRRARDLLEKAGEADQVRRCDTLIETIATDLPARNADLAARE